MHGNALLDFFQLTPRLSLPRIRKRNKIKKNYLGLQVQVQILMMKLLLRLQIELG